MCGLVGCAGPLLDMKHERAFRDLLIVDTIRGPDSTGIMATHTSGDITLFKKALLPNDLFTMKGCQDIFARQNKVLIGHNRWATKGKINATNAHPFEFDTLVGAHNGTLVNQRLLPDFNDFEVDSENIFHSFEKIGIKDTVAALHGAFALTWYDKIKESVNIIRNKERPLFVTYTKDNHAVFWASESWMLTGVLAKNDIEHGEIYDTVANTHYEFRIPNRIYNEPATYLLSKPVQTKLTPWEAPPVPKSQTGNVVNGRFTRNNGGSNQNGATSTTKGHGGTKPAWDYEIGEEVIFRLDPDSPKKANYIVGLQAHNTMKKVKIFARKGSWLRANLECDDILDVYYTATVNGYSSIPQKGKGNISQGVTAQENSVYTLAPPEAETVSVVDAAIADAKRMKPESRNDQIMALRVTQGTCSWCGDPITPNPDHVYVDGNTIICKDCKNSDDQLIKDYLGVTKH